MGIAKKKIVKSGSRNGWGKRQNKKNGATKKKTKTYVHEEWCNSIFYHAFWPPDAPPCDRCKKRKTRCPVCRKIETKRYKYTQGGRKGWFDFDAVLKIPDGVDEDGNTHYRLVAVIETDGPSHFDKIKQFGGRKGLKDQKRRDGSKKKFCDLVDPAQGKKKIHMIRIPCYFTKNRRTGAYDVPMTKPCKDRRPNPPVFIKNVHNEVIKLKKLIDSGALGQKVKRHMQKHWDPNWIHSPKANPHLNRNT